jgi:hypothetical protein
MIQLTREKILFSLPTSAVLLDDDPRKRPLERELVSAHVCSHCGTVAQAIYKTEDRIVNLTKDFFGLEKEMAPGKFAVSTPRHEVQPRYKSFLFELAGGSCEMLVESYHGDYETTKAMGRCPYSRLIYRPGPFDLCYYLLSVASIIDCDEWYRLSVETRTRMRLALASPDAERNQANARIMLDQLQGVPKRFHVAEDVTGNGPPVWLLSRNDWNGYILDRVLRSEQIKVS